MIDDSINHLGLKFTLKHCKQYCNYYSFHNRFLFHILLFLEINKCLVVDNLQQATADAFTCPYIAFFHIIFDPLFILLYDWFIFFWLMFICLEIILLWLRWDFTDTLISQRFIVLGNIMQVRFCFFCCLLTKCLILKIPNTRFWFRFKSLVYFFDWRTLLMWTLFLFLTEFFLT